MIQTVFRLFVCSVNYKNQMQTCIPLKCTETKLLVRFVWVFSHVMCLQLSVSPVFTNGRCQSDG